ncbi:MAG: tRNA (N(6)-L-threonylcarbamoyladenosine(37)-C(2))-methylthiotransferase MtaB [Chloroflexia bacterium]
MSGDNRPLRAALATLGCRVNFSETDHLRGRLQAAGYVLVDFEEEADLYIVNTCTVTHVADRKSRQLLRRAARHNGALVVAVGCYADVAAPLLRRMEGVDLVLTREEEPFLESRLADLWRARGREVPAALPEAAPLLPSSPARALIQVQDGCDNRCAYCIVRLARGPGRSRPAGEVLEEVRQVERAGYPEIILTGINLGAYRDPEVGNLAGLARRILEETGIRRIRFSSIEPQDFPLELLELFPEPRLCRHFHLPLQSGCDRTLERMGRRYRFSDFRALVEEIHRRIPEVGLTTDVIVGFPGEAEEDFAESLRAIATLPLSDLHIFPFSLRPGTEAAAMEGHLPPALIHRRCEEMHLLARRMARAFREAFIGRELVVLWDGRAGAGWSGLSDNYLRVSAATPGNWLARLTRTRITGSTDTALVGQIVDFVV